MGRIGEMLGLLIALNGMAGSRERLAAEKRRGKMACQWDVSVARAAERVKAKGLVKAVEKWAQWKAAEDKRAEEASVQQEE